MATIVIEDWMIRDEKLSGTPLLAFALIHGCTQKGEGCWYGGYEKLAERVGVTTRGVIKSINLLVESGRIERCDGIIDGKMRKVLRSCINYEHSSREQSSYEQSSQERVNKVHVKGEQSSCPSNNKVKENIKENKIADFSQDVEELYAIYPTKCPKSGRGTDKGRESKKILVRLLKNHSRQEIESAIRLYLDDCNKTNTFIKNFDSLLHRIERGDISGDLFQPQEQADNSWLVEGKRYRKEEFEGHDNELYLLNIELIKHVKRGGALTWRDGKFIIAK